MTVAACLLASKVEECPRNLQDFAFLYLKARVLKKPQEIDRMQEEKVGFPFFSSA